MAEEYAPVMLNGAPIGPLSDSDETYLRGRYNTQEGGTKGVDIHPGGAFMIVTCECNPLAVYHLPSLLAQIPAPGGP